MILESQYSPNLSLHVKDTIDSDDDLRFQMLRDGDEKQSMYLRKEQVRALRDHLNMLLGEDVTTTTTSWEAELA